MSRARWATPVTPTRLPPRAARMPATCVPWPLSSDGSPSRLTKSAPLTSSTKPLPSSSMPLPGISRGLRHRLSRRSGCVRSAPVSMTATTVLPPVETSHALWTPRTLSSASDHCSSNGKGDRQVGTIVLERPRRGSLREIDPSSPPVRHFRTHQRALRGHAHKLRAPRPEEAPKPSIRASVPSILDRRPLTSRSRK